MVLYSLLMVASFSQGQATEVSPPPLVPAPQAQVAPPPPPPMPAPEQPSTAAPAGPVGTPPPPSLAPPPHASPYGQPRLAPDGEKPPVEYGLMISEGLFGMLTAAGVSLLPYFILFRPFVLGENSLFTGNDTLGTVLYAVIFAALPLTTAQTEVSIANGSRWYYSDMWPAALVGLGTEAAVLGLAYLAAGQRNPSTGVRPIANELVLLIGTIGVMPLAQMAIINLIKGPRFGKGSNAPIAGGGGLVRYRDGKGLAVGVPNVAPILSRSREGMLDGLQLSLFSGRF